MKNLLFKKNCFLKSLLLKKNFRSLSVIFFAFFGLSSLADSNEFNFVSAMRQIQSVSMNQFHKSSNSGQNRRKTRGQNNPEMTTTSFGNDEEDDNDNEKNYIKEEYNEDDENDENDINTSTKDKKNYSVSKRPKPVVKVVKKVVSGPKGESPQSNDAWYSKENNANVNLLCFFQQRNYNEFVKAYITEPNETFSKFLDLLHNNKEVGDLLEVSELGKRRRAAFIADCFNWNFANDFNKSGFARFFKTGFDCLVSSSPLFSKYNEEEGVYNFSFEKKQKSPVAKLYKKGYLKKQAEFVDKVMNKVSFYSKSKQNVVFKELSDYCVSFLIRNYNSLPTEAVINGQEIKDYGEILKAFLLDPKLLTEYLVENPLWFFCFLISNVEPFLISDQTLGNDGLTADSYCFFDSQLSYNIRNNYARDAIKAEFKPKIIQAYEKKQPQVKVNLALVEAQALQEALKFIPNYYPNFNIFSPEFSDICCSYFENFHDGDTEVTDSLCVSKDYDKGEDIKSAMNKVRFKKAYDVLNDFQRNEQEKTVEALMKENEEEPEKEQKDKVKELREQIKKAESADKFSVLWDYLGKFLKSHPLVDNFYCSIVSFIQLTSKKLSYSFGTKSLFDCGSVFANCYRLDPIVGAFRKKLANTPFKSYGEYFIYSNKCLSDFLNGMLKAAYDEASQDLGNNLNGNDQDYYVSMSNMYSGEGATFLDSFFKFLGQRNQDIQRYVDNLNRNGEKLISWSKETRQDFHYFINLVVLLDLHFKFIIKFFTCLSYGQEFDLENFLRDYMSSDCLSDYEKFGDPDALKLGYSLGRQLKNFNFSENIDYKDLLVLLFDCGEKFDVFANVDIDKNVFYACRNFICEYDHDSKNGQCRDLLSAFCNDTKEILFNPLVNFYFLSLGEEGKFDPQVFWNTVSEEDEKKDELTEWLTQKFNSLLDKVGLSRINFENLEEEDLIETPSKRLFFLKAFYLLAYSYGLITNKQVISCLRDLKILVDRFNRGDFKIVAKPDVKKRNLASAELNLNFNENDEDIDEDDDDDEDESNNDFGIKSNLKNLKKKQVKINKNITEKGNKESGDDLFGIPDDESQLNMAPNMRKKIKSNSNINSNIVINSVSNPALLNKDFKFNLKNINPSSDSFQKGNVTPVGGEFGIPDDESQLNIKPNMSKNIKSNSNIIINPVANPALQNFKFNLKNINPIPDPFIKGNVTPDGESFGIPDDESQLNMAPNMRKKIKSKNKKVINKNDLGKLGMISSAENKEDEVIKENITGEFDVDDNYLTQSLTKYLGQNDNNNNEE